MCSELTWQQFILFHSNSKNVLRMRTTQHPFLRGQSKFKYDYTAHIPILYIGRASCIKFASRVHLSGEGMWIFCLKRLAFAGWEVVIESVNGVSMQL